MSLIHSQPHNFNYFDSQGFLFSLARSPNAVFFVARAMIPGFTAVGPKAPSPFIDMPREPDKGEFDPLTLTFMVDEDLAVFTEMYDWIVPMSYPSEFSEHAFVRNSVAGDGKGLFSDATLTLLTSKNNGNFEINFRNMLPTSFGTIQLSVQDEVTNYAMLDVTFSYERYTIRRIGSRNI